MSMQGKTHSEATKLKMSKAALGNKSFSGHKHTEEWKQKMSGPRPNRKGIPAWNKGLKNPALSERNRVNNPTKRGAEHPWWKGGITPLKTQIRNSSEYKQWREAVYERDGYACVLCGIQGDITSPFLQADHIKSFNLHPELRKAVDNGRVLCLNCHCQTDNYKGRAKK